MTQAIVQTDVKAAKAARMAIIEVVNLIKMPDEYTQHQGQVAHQEYNPLLTQNQQTSIKNVQI